MHQTGYALKVNGRISFPIAGSVEAVQAAHEPILRWLAEVDGNVVPVKIVRVRIEEAPPE